MYSKCVVHFLLNVDNIWCDLGESVRSCKCDIFCLIDVLIRRGTFCWKPHLNRSSGSEVMSNWKILRTIENNRNSFLFLAISHNQWCRLPADPARSQHIMLQCSTNIMMMMFMTLLVFNKRNKEKETILIWAVQHTPTTTHLYSSGCRTGQERVVYKRKRDLIVVSDEASFELVALQTSASFVYLHYLMTANCLGGLVRVPRTSHLLWCFVGHPVPLLYEIESSEKKSVKVTYVQRKPSVNVFVIFNYFQSQVFYLLFLQWFVFYSLPVLSFV